MNYDGIQLCGVEDTLGVGQMCRWPMIDVSWSIRASLPQFAVEDFREACELAWYYWSSVCGIRPRYTPNNLTANLVIGLQTIGPGGVLADCELPCGASQASSLRMRIDTQEAWVIAENPPGSKIDLVRVVCHELGHGIGIPHIGGANLMAPTYNARLRRPQVGDIAEAVARYGTPVAVPPPPVPPSDEYEEVTAILRKGGKIFVRTKGVVTEL